MASSFQQSIEVNRFKSKFEIGKTNTSQNFFFNVEQHINLNFSNFKCFIYCLEIQKHYLRYGTHYQQRYRYVIADGNIK